MIMALMSVLDNDTNHIYEAPLPNTINSAVRNINIQSIATHTYTFVYTYICTVHIHTQHLAFFK
jgi:hypothetical protein